MNTEEDEFKRIEREAAMRKRDDDDDIQDYVRPWMGLTDEEMSDIWNEGGWYVDMFKAVEAKLREKNS